MAITDIENNDLSALAEHKNMVGEGYGYGYYEASGKKKVKTIAQGVSIRSQADENFKKQMVRLYQNMKGDIGIRNASLKNIESPNGVEVVYQVVQTFGSPTNEKSLEKHNAYVDVFLKYFVPTSATQGVDCQNLEKTLGELEADNELAEKRAAAGNRPDMAQAVSIAYATRISQVKKMMIGANCQAKKEEEESAKATQQTLSTLQQATAPTTTAPDNTTKYVTYGLGGAILLIAIVVLLKK